MPTDFRAIARQKAMQHGLLPDVFERQIEAESGFNPKAISPAGACGIAQIMPSTAKSWGVNCNDPVASLGAAAKNMAGYVKTYLGGKTPAKETDPSRLRGAYEKALQAYNAGPGSVGRYLPEETKGYIQKIIGPDKFSFTEALQGSKPESKQQEISSVPGGQTFVIYQDQTDEKPSALRFLEGFMKNAPSLQPAIDPSTFIAQAPQLPAGAAYAAPRIKDWS